MTHRLATARPRATNATALTTTIATALTTLALTPAAQARIVPGRSIGPVELGMTQAQVRAKLGKPLRTLGVTAWHYPDPPLRGDVGFDKRTKRVNGIVTTWNRQRTSKGIGPGSKQRALHKAYPGARCAFNQVEFVTCTITTRAGGKTVPSWFVALGDGAFYAAGVGVDPNRPG